MWLSTKDVGSTAVAKTTGSTKREKVQNLRKQHNSLFIKENVINPKFIPRMCYKHEGELIVGFYEREILGGKDIYTEFCDRDFNPEDPKRTLWKWQFNSEYKTEYKLSDPHPGTKDCRYLIPIDELINVKEVHYPTQQVVTVEEKVPEAVTPAPVVKEVVKETPAEALLDAPSAGEDVPYADMTLRDYAAIKWQKPVSLRGWLNDLIIKNSK